MCGRRQTKKLDRNLLPGDELTVSSADNLSSFLKEGVLEVGIVVSIFRTVFEKLRHGNNRDAEVDSESVKYMQ